MVIITVYGQANERYIYLIGKKIFVEIGTCIISDTFKITFAFRMFRPLFRQNVPLLFGRDTRTPFIFRSVSACLFILTINIVSIVYLH
jgi:hypothetical protein